MRKEIGKDNDRNPIFTDLKNYKCKVCRTSWNQPISAKIKCPNPECEQIQVGITAGAD